ncbi:MAG: homoserine O-acetyltransferase [Leptospiraceae bacterium]|nr:homoserine O-acetyltransferase [Leptospiraceae bacterium]
MVQAIDNKTALSEKIYVETQNFPIPEFTLENGETLYEVNIAYETYGNLNASRSNAILILHAFSGDAHAAFYHQGDTRPGWWDRMIGPGKAFDTDRYFIICSNVLGGCAGSTGPSSINPRTGKRYALEFPQITIKDMVNAQKLLIDHLGIDKLYSIAGGSMGGMQALQWLVSYPERVRSAIPIATTARHSPQQIAFNEVGRQAIMADPNWNYGNYYDGEIPRAGLAVARMIGHITYMSEKSMAEKFGRRTKAEEGKPRFHPDFEVENYLRSRGDNFVRRFDANSYLYISKAMDLFDVSEGRPLSEKFYGLQAKLLVLSYKSDWLYPAHQSLEIVSACKIAGVPVTYVDIEAHYGHDSFLVETEIQSQLVKNFLARVGD